MKAKPIRCAFGALVAMALSTLTMHAAGADTWIGNTDANWNTSANWTTSGGSTPPANGDSLVFGAAGSAGTSLNNNITSLSVGGFTINSGASAFIFGGNGIILNGTLTDGASVNETFSGGITLGSAFTAIKNTGSGVLDLGALTQTAGSGGSVNFTPTGTIHTTAANNNGILGGWATVGNAGTAGATADWAAVDGSGNLITYAGYTAVSTASATTITLDGTQTALNYKAGNSPTSVGTAYTTTWAKTGGGTGTINSLAVVNDNVINTGVTLSLGSGGLILEGISRWIKAPNGNNSDTAQLTSGLASGELFVDSPGAGGSTDNNWIIWAKIVDNGGTAVKLVKNGPGYLRLGNANTYSGGTIMNGGTLIVDSGNYIGGGNVTVNAGTLNLNVNAKTMANNFSVAAGAAAIFDNAVNNGTLNGNFTGSGTVTIQNTSTANLSENVGGSWSGFTGTLNYNTASKVVNFFAPASMDLSHATVSFANSGNLANSSFRTSGTTKLGSLAGFGYLDVVGTVQIGNLNASTTYSGLIRDNGSPGSVTLLGSGALTVSGASTYTGTTTVENGSLIAGAAVAVSAAGPFGNASSAIALGDATSISGNSSPSLFIGGAFTMARPVTVGSGNGATTGIYTLGGNTANNATFSGAIILNQSLVVTQATGGTLTLSGAITNATSGALTVTFNNVGSVTNSTAAIGNGSAGGTVALTKTGAGTLTLSAANTYTGNTTVNGGTLVVNGSIASGSTVSVSGSSSVLGGSGTVNGNTSIGSSGALTPRAGSGSATTLTFGGNLTLASASANFTLSSAAAGSNDKVNYGSSATLTVDNTDTINITGTPLDTTTDYTLFTSTGGTVSMATTPTLKVNGVTSDQTSAGNYKLQISGDGHSLLLHYIAAGIPPSVNSASASPASLGHYQTTTVTVNVTPAAGQTINSVTVTVDGLSGAGDPVTLTGPGGDGTGNWTGTFTAAGTLAAGSYTISGAVNQSDGGVAAWSASGILVTNASPVWGGTGSDNKWSTIANWNAGSGPAPGNGDSVILAGSTQMTNNLDHSVSVVSLTFNAGAGNFDITNAANTLTLTGGMTNNSANAQTLDVPVALSGAQTINAASGSIAISRAVSDSGTGFTKAGGGTLTLSGVNTYSGATTISGGALTLGGAGQLGGGTYSAVITNNGALNYNSSASQTLSGAISGTGAVTNGGSGALTLSSGASTFGGGIIINTGSVMVAASSTPTSGAVTSGPLGTGTVTLNGGTLNAGVNEGTIANNINVTAASTIQTYNSYNWNLNGNISGSGNITYNAPQFAATLRLGGDNHNYSGTFTVSGGNNNAAITWTSASAGSSNATWSLNNTWSASSRMGINFGNGTIDFGALTGNGLNLQNSSSGSTAIMRVGGLNTSTVFSGTMIANGTAILGLTKVGTGSLTLSGANTYTGPTTISNGTLLVNGSLGNTAVTVSGGALGGVGTIGGATTAQPGSTLVAGTNSVGTLTFSSSLTLDAASTNAFAVTANGSSNKVVVTGLLTPNNSVIKITSGTPLPLSTNRLFTYGTISGSFAATPVMDVAPVHSPSIVDDGAGHINLVVANHAPVATVYNCSRNAGITTLKIALTDLATHWSDADGDTMSFVSVNASTNGVIVSTNGGYVLYNNTNNVDDQFTYVITDSYGATATGVVNITVTGGTTSTQNIASLTHNNDGSYTLNLAGIPGYTYRTEATTNLITGPWIDISTNTAGTNGLWQVNDSDATNYPSRYYRTVYP